MDQGDVESDRDIMQYFSLGVSQQELDRADVHQDGIIDEEDIRTLEDVLKHYVDISGDGVVDAEDIRIVDRLISLSQNPLSPQEAERADINGDGIINYLDEEKLLTVLDHLVDMNQDQKVDTEDLNRLCDVLDVWGLKLSAKERHQADINKD